MLMILSGSKTFQFLTDCSPISLLRKEDQTPYSKVSSDKNCQFQLVLHEVFVKTLPTIYKFFMAINSFVKALFIILSGSFCRKWSCKKCKSVCVCMYADHNEDSQFKTDDVGSVPQNVYVLVTDEGLQPWCSKCFKNSKFTKEYSAKSKSHT